MATRATGDPVPEPRLSRAAYRYWAETQPTGRFERIDGVVVTQAPQRLHYADRKALVWLAPRRAILAARLPCHVYPDGMTVEVDDSDFEPDAILHCGPKLPGNAIAVPDPLVVVEVLSPSTRGDDLTRKLVWRISGCLPPPLPGVLGGPAPGDPPQAAGGWGGHRRPHADGGKHLPRLARHHDHGGRGVRNLIAAPPGTGPDKRRIRAILGK